MTPWFGSFRREPSPPPLEQEEEEDPEEGRARQDASSLDGITNKAVAAAANHDHQLQTSSTAVVPAAAILTAQQRLRLRRRAGATFSSTKCPPQAGRSHACEIPFGLIWSPMMTSTTPTTTGRPATTHTNTATLTIDANHTLNATSATRHDSTNEMDMHGCRSCLAYLNMYAAYDASTGRWTCPLCGSNENVAPSPQLMECLVSPMVEYRQPTTTNFVPSSSPNQKDEDECCTIVIVLDGNLPLDEVQSILLTLSHTLAQQQQQPQSNHAKQKKIQLGLVVFSSMVSLYQLGVPGVASADLVSPSSSSSSDSSTTHKQQSHFQKSRSYLSSLEEGGWDSLVRCVSAYFGSTLLLDSMDPNSPSPQPPQYGMTSSLPTTTRHDHNMDSTLTSNNKNHNNSLSRKERLRLKREERIRRETATAHHPSTTTFMDPNHGERNAPFRSMRMQRQKQRRHFRCTGEAVQRAIALASSFSSSSVSSHHSTSRVLLFTNGCPNVGMGSVVASSSNDDDEPHVVVTTVSSKDVPPISRDHHVVEPSMLATAATLFRTMGTQALEQGVGIDVLCTGATALGMSALNSLVSPSGGYALPHPSFATPQFHSNLGFLLKETHISRTGRRVDSVSSISMDRGTNNRGAPSSSTTVPNNRLDGCIVDVRYSSFVTPTHVVGPGEIVYEENPGLLPNERAMFASDASLAARQGLSTNQMPMKEWIEGTRLRIRLGRYDPLSTLSIMMEMNETLQPDVDTHGFFQCVARFVEDDGKTLVTRVSTHRLPMARSVNDFLDSIDEDVVPVLLGREAVYRSMVGRGDDVQTDDVAVLDKDRAEILAHDARRDLDNTVHRISSSFRLLGLQNGFRSGGSSEDIGSATSSLDFAFPPELADALHLLHHLRRGPMLGPGPLQNFDDCAEMRTLFMRLPLEDCLCMMAPTLWSCRINTLENAPDLTLTMLEPVPADTLTLWDSCIIAADHHDSLFVWSGRATLHSRFDGIREECRQFLLERAKHRFPMPQLHMLSEGDSMGRRLTTRLAPSHADAPEQQLVHFPALESLTEQERVALQNKFRFYDASADESFRRWFWSVASATSNARREGVTLLE